MEFVENFTIFTPQRGGVSQNSSPAMTYYRKKAVLSMQKIRQIICILLHKFIATDSLLCYSFCRKVLFIFQYARLSKKRRLTQKHPFREDSKRVLCFYKDNFCLPKTISKLPTNQSIHRLYMPDISCVIVYGTVG